MNRRMSESIGTPNTFALLAHFVQFVPEWDTGGGTSCRGRNDSPLDEHKALAFATDNA